MGDGVYRIRNRASGKLLDLTMTGTANGTWLHLWEDVGGTSQMWELCPTPEGTVRLRSSWAGGKCVDTVGMGAEAGAVLQIWQEVPGADQLWTIAEVKDRAKRAAKTEEPKAAEAVNMCINKPGYYPFAACVHGFTAAEAAYPRYYSVFCFNICRSVFQPGIFNYHLVFLRPDNQSSERLL